MKDEFLEYLNSSSGISQAMLEAARQAYGITRCLEESSDHRKPSARLALRDKILRTASLNGHTLEYVTSDTDDGGMVVYVFSYRELTITVWFVMQNSITVHATLSPRHDSLKSILLYKKIRYADNCIQDKVGTFPTTLVSWLRRIDSADTVSELDDDEVLVKLLSGGGYYPKHIVTPFIPDDCPFDEIFTDGHVYDDPSGITRRALADLASFLDMDMYHISPAIINNFTDMKMDKDVYEEYARHLIASCNATELLAFTRATMNPDEDTLMTILHAVVDKIKADPLQYTDLVHAEETKDNSVPADFRRSASLIGLYAHSLVG